jgi:hypothetical protein
MAKLSRRGFLRGALAAGVATATAGAGAAKLLQSTVPEIASSLNIHEDEAEMLLEDVQKHVARSPVSVQMPDRVWVGDPAPQTIQWTKSLDKDDWGSSSGHEQVQIDYYKLRRYWTEEAGKQLACQIDKDILDTIQKDIDVNVKHSVNRLVKSIERDISREGDQFDAKGSLSIGDLQATMVNNPPAWYSGKPPRWRPKFELSAGVHKEKDFLGAETWVIKHKKPATDIVDVSGKAFT